MKLKKLLPITAMASVAAVAAPLVTSCAQKGTEFIWNIDDGEPAADIYFIQPKDFGDKLFEGHGEVFKSYVDEASKNKSILAKDMFEHIYYENTESAPLIPGFQIKSLSVRVDNVDAENGRFSFHTERQYTWTWNDKKVTQTVIIDAQNIDYYITTSGGVWDTWYFIPYISLIDFVRTQNGIDDRETVWREYVSKLSKDKSWHLNMIDKNTNGSYVEQNIDCSNIVDMYIEDRVPSYEESYTSGLFFASTYYYNALLDL